MTKNFLFYSLMFFIAITIAGCKLSGQVSTTAGEPVEGVTIVLSGAASMTTTIDSNGKYEFEVSNNANSYIITPSAIDYTFTPAQLNVEITASTRNDIDGLDFTATEGTPNTFGMTFNYIAPGTFMMGSPIDEPGRNDDETLHQVTLTNGYYIQTTVVTQEQWQAVMGTTPWLNSDGTPKYPGIANPNKPAVYINYYDVQEFLSALNEQSDGSYRLPTEAEWEYAARAGSTTAWSFGDNDDVIHEYGWINESTASGESLHEVGLLKPNANGLYDIHGNVWELCEDFYGPYPSGPVTDPVYTTGEYHEHESGADTGHVYRGAASYWIARIARSAYRAPNTIYWETSGFRLVRD